MACSGCAQRREAIKKVAAPVVETVRKIAMTAENAGRRLVKYGIQRRK